MNKKAVYGVIAVVVIALAGLMFYGGMRGTSALKTQTAQSGIQMGTVGVNAPTITSAVMSRSIDAKGNATGVATLFDAKTDKTLYAVLTLANVVKGTKLSYIRSINGKYVDSKVAVATRDGITTFYFSFEKGIGDYPKGSYALKLYVNGAQSTTLNYVFK